MTGVETMWTLVNHSPFSAVCTGLLDREGAPVLVVAVRATLALDLRGQLSLAQWQHPVVETPEYFGAPGNSTLRWDADVGPGRPLVDMVVHGHVYAPGGEPCKEALAELRIGALTKVILAIGERRWERRSAGLCASPAVPFERVPLRWELAFGGPGEPENPIGRGLAAKEPALEGCLLPQLEHPAHRIVRWSDRPPPIGLAPIDRTWSPRREFAGTYDAGWQRARMPLLPRDYDPRFEQCAPSDQQITLTGGEPVALTQLSPAGPLRFSVPRIACELGVAKDRLVVARLVLLVIEPDERRLHLVWHAALRVTDGEVHLRASSPDVRLPELSPGAYHAG